MTEPLSVTDDKCPTKPQISCFPQWEYYFHAMLLDHSRSDHRVQKWPSCPPVGLTTRQLLNSPQVKKCTSWEIARDREQLLSENLPSTLQPLHTDMKNVLEGTEPSRNFRKQTTCNEPCPVRLLPMLQATKLTFCT